MVLEHIQKEEFLRLEASRECSELEQVLMGIHP